MQFLLLACWIWSLPWIVRRLSIGIVSKGCISRIDRSVSVLVATPSNGSSSRLVSAKSYCATSALLRFCSGCSGMGCRVVDDPFSSKRRSRLVSAVEPGAWGLMSGSTCASREGLSFACPACSSLARTLFRLFYRLDLFLSCKLWRECLTD